MPAGATDPPEEDVARGLHEALAGHDPLPMVAEPALGEVPFEHGALGLLHLEEERIGVVATCEQRDEATRADAPDADHLPRQVDELVLLQEMLAVVLERATVLTEEGLDLDGELGRFDADDERWIVDDPRPAVDDGRELRERLQAVLRPGLRHHGVSVRLRIPARGRGGQDLLGRDVAIPDVEVAHAGELGHPRPVGLNRRHRRLPSGALREPDRARPDHEARGHPLHVPLPRPGERLVEVVQIEHHPAFRRTEDAEVRQVRVTADLRLDPADRRPGQVVGHHDRRPSVERER